MTVDTLYSVEVLPNTVRYYGVENVPKKLYEETEVIIKLSDLMEIMKYASENHEVLKTISTLDIDENDEDELARKQDEAELAIQAILKKQADFDKTK